MNEIEVLDERQHVLLRSQMYLGSLSNTLSNEYILENNKFIKKDITYIPALVKIINEIIDNSVDISIKTDFKECNLVDVTITDDYVQIIDNGPGIPVKKAFNKVTNKEEYMPFTAWGHAMAGSNFKENSKGIGSFGVGSFCTNVWSTKFVGISDDGNQRYKVIFTDNASNSEETVTKSSKKGVTVKFYPDLQRFKIDKIDDTVKEVIKQRLINLNLCFPKIKFRFNNKQLNVNSFKNYVKLFNNNFEIVEAENYSFAILPSTSDDFEQFSYVNGLKMSDGGQHIDNVVNEVTKRLRDKLCKKYKTLKPADIRNKLFVIMFMRNFSNPKFNSQTKEKLTNSIAEVNDYLGNVDYDTLCKKILKNNSIIDPIVEVFKIKEEFKRRQELKQLDKAPKKIKDEHYLPATKNKKYLLIVEGQCLSENTEVLTNNFKNVKLKDIDVGAKLLNSSYNEVEVLAKTEKLTKTLKITSNGEEIICGYNHPIFVYNIETKQFEFVTAKDLDKTKHKLVKSKINSKTKILKVINIYNNIINTDETEISFTENDYFAILRDGKILRVNSNDLKVNDYLILS